MAPLAEVLIDDVTWSCATRARRAEWQQTIAELIDEAHFTARAEGPLRAYVTVHKTGIVVALHDGAGRESGRMELPESAIAPIFKEYMGIVRDMMNIRRNIQSPHFEALDIAKRLTHDDAAETVSRHFLVATPDHQTARRLFTLLLVLTHDTTKLGRIPG